MVTSFCAQELNSQSRAQNTLISIHELTFIHVAAGKFGRVQQYVVGLRVPAISCTGAAVVHPKTYPTRFVPLVAAEPDGRLASG